MRGTNRNRRKRRKAKSGAIVDFVLLGHKISARLDLSISEFCAKHDISRPTYVNYRNAGLGPVETVVAGRVTISAAADAEWQERFARPARGRPRKATGAVDGEGTVAP